MAFYEAANLLSSGWETALVKVLACKHEDTFGSSAPIEAKCGGDVYKPSSEEASGKAEAVSSRFSERSYHNNQNQKPKPINW